MEWWPADGLGHQNNHHHHHHHHQQSTINNQQSTINILSTNQHKSSKSQIHELRPPWIPASTAISTGLRHSVGSRTSTVPEASCKVLSFTKRPLAGTSDAAYPYQQRRVSCLNISLFWGQKDFVHVLGVVNWLCTGCGCFFEKM